MGDEFITLARVLKTQGRRGEVAVEVHTDVPDRFVAGMRLFALDEVDKRRELEVEDLWPHKSHLVLKFQGVDSIADAETLLRCELQVPLHERAELEPGWTFTSDLTGCTVYDDEQKTPYEIPYAESYLVKVDLAGKQIRMRLPEGMLEINAALTEEEKREQKGSGWRRE